VGHVEEVFDAGDSDGVADDAAPGDSAVSEFHAEAFQMREKVA
jgi:hypothetical protein